MFSPRAGANNPVMEAEEVSEGTIDTTRTTSTRGITNILSHIFQQPLPSTWQFLYLFRVQYRHAVQNYHMDSYANQWVAVPTVASGATKGNNGLINQTWSRELHHYECQYTGPYRSHQWQSFPWLWSTRSTSEQQIYMRSGWGGEYLLWNATTKGVRAIAPTTMMTTSVEILHIYLWKMT